MTKQDFIKKILPHHDPNHHIESGHGFAATNIALVKYWGKRDAVLNLPQTASLSITLPEKVAFTQISLTSEPHHQIYLNDRAIELTHPFAKQIINFLNLFLFATPLKLKISTQINIPVSAGLASSACGFAALTLALNHFFNWQLERKNLSLLARLGSGSACRSFWPGFVKWYRGDRDDGSDSFAEPLIATWPDLRVGLLTINQASKAIGSRQAMINTRTTSYFYQLWPDKVKTDMVEIERAITTKDFLSFGQVAENNALAMHASMLTAQPPICYWQPESLKAMHQIWQARQKGLELFFTQDAGPNIKLLFLAKDTAKVQVLFPELDLLMPFQSSQLAKEVILVDEDDRALGHTDKLAAHQKGQCHRAFSVFIFRYWQDQLQLLLQRRHPNKYHCGNLWTNTCCSHPHPGENMLNAAQQRLQQEMGFTAELFPAGKFHYRTRFDNGLTENEVDHVWVGFAQTQTIHPDSSEVSEYVWLNIPDLQTRLMTEPYGFTPWLAQGLELALSSLKQIK